MKKEQQNCYQSLKFVKPQCQTSQSHIFKLLQNYSNQFTCPITQIQMQDPFITQDGHSYQKNAISKWFITSFKSPKTGLKLDSKKLIPNHSLKYIIQRYNQFEDQIYEEYVKLIDKMLHYLDEETKTKIHILGEIKDIYVKQTNKNSVSTKIQQTQFCINDQRQNNKNQMNLKTNINLTNQNLSNIQSLMNQSLKCTLQFKQQIKNSFPKIYDFISSDKYKNPLSPQQKKIPTAKNFFKHYKQSNNSIFCINQYLLQPYTYLLQRFNFDQQQINDRYRKDKYSHEIGLWHNKIPLIEVQKFIQYDWNVLQFLNLVQCNIGNQSWRILAENARKIFKKLSTLCIYGNSIQSVKETEIKMFQSLKCLQFWHHHGLSNPLNGQTKKMLKNFKRTNTQIYIEYQL